MATEPTYFVSADIDGLIFDQLDQSGLMCMCGINQYFYQKLANRRQRYAEIDNHKSEFKKACKLKSLWMVKYIIYNNMSPEITEYVQYSLKVTERAKDGMIHLCTPRPPTETIMPMVPDPKKYLTEWYHKNIVQLYSSHTRWYYGIAKFLEDVCEYGCRNIIEWIISEAYSPSVKRYFIDPPNALYNACTSEDIDLIDYIIGLIIATETPRVSSNIFQYVFSDLISNNKSIQIIQYIFNRWNQIHPSESIKFLHTNIDDFTFQKSAEIVQWQLKQINYNTN